VALPRQRLKRLRAFSLLAALAARLHREIEGGETMLRADQNTIVPLYDGGEIVGRGAAVYGSRPESCLHVSCDVVHRRDAGTSGVLRVTGNVDSGTSDELLHTIEHFLRADPRSRLILNLEDVARMDSSGIGALLAGLRDAEKEHVRFTLCGLRKPLREMLERTRLASLFEIRPTVEEALCH
jgi:anti-anti-sigma factor